MLDPDSFRAVLGRFASGVTVVTTIDAKHACDCGMTVSAFCSLSLDPPLVLFCAEHGSEVRQVLTYHDCFVVNMLSNEQEPLARRFAAPEQKQARFDGIGYTRSENGVVILDEVLGHLECRKVRSYEEGDHTVFVGEVERAACRDARPLLYYRGGYAQLER